MMEATLSLPNAIVFVLDLENKSIDVPKYVSGVLVAANEACVSVGAQAEVDGQVTVKLSQGFSSSEKAACIAVFDGAIDTPSGRIALVTSELEMILEMTVPRTKTLVRIWVDHVPGTILVEAT